MELLNFMDRHWEHFSPDEQTALLNLKKEWQKLNRDAYEKLVAGEKRLKLQALQEINTKDQ